MVSSAPGKALIVIPERRGVDFGAFGPTPAGPIIQLSRGPALQVVLL